MVDALAQLQAFINNPFFSFFTGQLQNLSDNAVASIVTGFITRDKIAILEREQTIGAAPAFLKFGQLTLAVQQDLQEAVKLQQTEDNEH